MAKKIREKVNDIKIRKKGLLSRMKSMPLTSRFSIVIVICMGIFVLILSGILFKNMKDDVIKECYGGSDRSVYKFHLYVCKNI